MDCSNCAYLAEALKRKTEMLDEVYGWLNAARRDLRQADVLIESKNHRIQILVKSLASYTGVTEAEVMTKLQARMKELHAPKMSDINLFGEDKNNA
jgi:hypothetical protein